MDVIVDTGFDSFLTLPAATVIALGLARHSSSSAVLGDGSVRQFENYSADVDWDGIWRPVLVSAIGDEVLLGMLMLAGYKLCVDAVPGGAVEITPLP